MKIFVYPFIIVFFSLNSWADSFHLPLVTRGFFVNDEFSLETSLEFNSEVESDYLTFGPKPCEYQIIENRYDSSACSAVGSLSKTRFFIDQVFLFTGEINDRTKFRAQFNKKQTYEYNSIGGYVEFLTKISGSHFVGIHGEYEAEKANDEIGFSYEKVGGRHHWRTQITFHDFTRNERNDNQDNFNVGPITTSASYLYTKNNSNFYLRLIAEPKWVWERPSVTTTTARTRHSVDGFYKDDNHYSSVFYLNDDLSINNDFQNSHIFRWHYETKKSWGTYGVRYVDKLWDTNAGILKHYDALPFVWLPWLIPNRNWDLGFEMTWHRSIGEDSLKSDSDEDTALEFRSNLSWVVFRSKSTYFRLLFTADLDKFGTGETWEGGNGQFLMTF